MDSVLDLVVIGAGPAGLNAALYAYRAGMKFVILKNMLSIDSQIVNTYEVENCLGFFKLSGQELYDKFSEHVKSFGIDIINDKVDEVIDSAEYKIVKTAKNEYKTKTVIIATGARPKFLNVEGEKNFCGRGVSYCATCDGAFYKGKTVAVVGGGDTAIEDALFLSKLAEKVFLLVRKDKFRAAKYLQDQVNNTKNIFVCFNTEIVAINGNDKVESVKIIHNVANVTKEVPLDGVFIAVGVEPETSLVADEVELKNGYILADESCATTAKGIFACGDVRFKQLRQVVTALSDGANAITSIERYINSMV